VASPSRPSGDRRQGAVARLVVGLLAFAIAAGTFYITSGLTLGWRIALATIVAAPLFLLVDLLRDSAGGHPRPRDDRRRGIDGNARRKPGTAQDSRPEDP
jgi:peptidoglycan/LPS O-acetylase OafA/YrhL